jgi:membrane protease YdiL (CAAX protease family)
MASEIDFQALLITVLLFALVARSLLLWVFEDDWPFHKVDLALCVLSILLSAVLAGLCWSEKKSIWTRILLGILSTIPSMQIVRHSSKKVISVLILA